MKTKRIVPYSNTLMDKKEILKILIENKGKCRPLPNYICVYHCPLKIFCRIEVKTYDEKYDESIKIFIKLFGEGILFEELL